jgi:BACON domain-containing protein/HYDIN/CFA65/VesB family protein
MQQCKFCGSTLPTYAHFCASCGNVIDDFTQGATYFSSPQELDMQTLEAIPPVGQEDENATISMQRNGEGSMFDSRYFDERRTDEDRAVLPGMILLGTEMVEGQAPAGNLPMVQGTPQVSGVPAVQGTPAMPVHPPAAQIIYHNAPASAPSAPPAPSWAPHISPPETPPAHHPRHQTSGELHNHDHHHQTSGELHTHHHPRHHRRRIPRPHGMAQHLLVAAVAVIIVATSAVTGALAIFRPALSLRVNGGITPGGTFQLHGVNFTPGSSVTLTLDDGIPLSSLGHGDVGEASNGAVFANVLQMSISAERSLQATAPGTSLPVSIQGTFDVTIQVGQNWLAGIHTIHATDRVLGRAADLKFTIPLAQAKLVVTPSSVLDFGSLEIGRKVALPVIVGNIGGRQLHWSAGVGSTPWLQVQPASGMILPGNHEQVVTIVANTSNLAAKDYSAVLHIVSDAGEAQIAVKLKVIPPGSSVKALLDVNPASLDFGTQAVGTQLTMNVTLANAGTQALSWGGDTGNASWLKLSSNSGNILPGGLPQILNVTADTTQLAAGNHSAILNITSNGGNKQIVVTIVVTPITSPAVLAVNPPGLDFGTMNPNTTQTLQEIVKNTGGQPLTWNSDTSKLPGWLSVDTSSGTVQPGGQQTIKVTAGTTNLSPGPYSANLNFTSNGGNKSVTVTLIVNAPTISPALITVGPKPLDFGSRDPNTTQTLQEVVKNPGGQALNWNLDTTSLPGWLSVDTSSGTVQPGGQQTIKVTANTSKLSPGPYSATLNFTSNGGNAQVPVTLAVNAPPPAQIVVTSNPLDFGAIDQNTTKTLQETVKNTGGQVLTWNLNTATLPGWLSVDTGNGTVQPGSQQAINVTANTLRLSPGPYSAVLNFTSNGGSATVKVSMTVNTPPPPPPVMGVSPNPLNFGSVTFGNSPILQEAVSNSGGQSLSWNLDPNSVPGWLSVDTGSGTVQPGGQQAINVTANTSNLKLGSYTATLSFTSSNGGGNVQVTVTITVVSPIG